MKDKTQKTKQVGTRKSGFSLMNLQLSLWMKIVIPIAVMAVLVLLVYYFKIPNPNMILIAGLVLCSAIFGYWGGAIAGVIMLVYTLYFFSTDHNFTDFSPENARKVVVSVVGICVDMFFVCALKNAENKAFKQVASLTEELRKENEELYRISFTDALTGLRNRMALKQDLAQYVGRQVTVLMLDVDRFKVINDTLGTTRATACWPKQALYWPNISAATIATATAATNF